MQKKAKNQAGVPRSEKVLREKNEKQGIFLERQRTKLMELVLLVHEFYPTQASRNPYQRLINRYGYLIPPDTRLLLGKLVHSLTLLHQLHRVQDKTGTYQSSREDVEAALQLMQHQLNPHIRLSTAEKQFYRLLTDHFKQELFTRYQVQQELGQSKTRAQHKLNKLHQSGLILRTGHKNKGYHYRLK